VYQGQKVHLFRPSLSFLAEAQPRLKTSEDKRHFLAEVHIEFFKLLNKSRFFLFAIQLLIVYGDRTIIGFVGFVDNLLNRPTDGATVSVRKRVTFRPLVST
jgi:hypothetical protein